MLTLAEANRHSTNKVKKGVIEEIVRDDTVLKKLPFDETDGIAYQYVRESSLGPSVTFIDPNEVIPEGTGTTTQVTVSLKILAAHADIDHHLAKTRKNYYDFAAQLIQMKAKGIKHRVMNRFWYSDDSVNSKEPDGMHALSAPNTSMVIERGSGSAGQVLTIDALDRLYDAFLAGDPDCWHMTRRTRRRLTAYLRVNGTLITDRDEWGNMVTYYQNVPIYVDNNLVDTEAVSGGSYSAETGGNTSSVFAVKYGPNSVFGLQNSGGLKVWKLAENLENKDSTRYRFLWYLAFGLGTTLHLGKITGIADGAVTA